MVEDELESDEEEIDEDEENEDQIPRAPVGTPDSNAFTSTMAQLRSSSAEGFRGESKRNKLWSKINRRSLRPSKVESWKKARQ